MFSLFHRDKLRGKAVDLKEEYRHKPEYDGDPPAIMYGIFRHGSSVKVGECDLRIGMNEELYYAGNIGYRIYEPYRGSGYAYEACLLLFQTAKQQFHMDELIITCSPDNTASEKTLEKLNGELIEQADVPATHWLYRRGEKVKNIFRYRL